MAEDPMDPMDHLEAADPDGNNVVANVDQWTLRCVIVTKHSITCIFLFLGGKESNICSPYISKMCQFLRK